MSSLRYSRMAMISRLRAISSNSCPVHQRFFVFANTTLKRVKARNWSLTTKRCSPFIRSSFMQRSEPLPHKPTLVGSSDSGRTAAFGGTRRNGFSCKVADNYGCLAKTLSVDGIISAPASAHNRRKRHIHSTARRPTDRRPDGQREYHQTSLTRLCSSFVPFRKAVLKVGVESPDRYFWWY